MQELQAKVTQAQVEIIDREKFEQGIGFTRMRGGDPASMPIGMAICPFYPHARG